MQIINNKLLALLFFGGLVAIISSGCKKDNDDDHDDDHVHTHIRLKFENKVGSSDVAYNTDYTINSRKMNFTTVRYYVSGITLMQEDGTEVTFDDYLLIKGENENSFELGDIEASHYHMVRFNIGLDSLTNHKDPSTYASGDALALQNDGNMHWSWNSGYIFLKMEGRTDTTASPDGTLDKNYEFHLGTDALLSSVQLASHFDVEEGQSVTVEIGVDLATLFTNVDLATENSCHTTDNMPLAEKVMGNVPAAFSILGTEHSHD